MQQTGHSFRLRGSFISIGDDANAVRLARQARLDDNHERVLGGFFFGTGSSAVVRMMSFVDH
jgi:hypothetical protein